MSVQVIDNFSYKGKKGNFERDNFDTLQAMRSYPEDGIDDGHVCFCNEDGNHYKFNHLNSVDGATGRWRLHNKSVNTLTETGEGKVLDARQGKILKDLIDAKVIEAGGVSFDTVPTKGSTNPVTSNGIKEAMDEQAESINSNMGVDDYPVFSASEAYSKGKVVNYNGKLYQFTSDHAAGTWTGTDVEPYNLKKDIEERYGTYTDNPEFIRVYTDAEGKFLWGIRIDGTVEWAKGVPTPVQNALKELADKLGEIDVAMWPLTASFSASPSVVEYTGSAKEITLSWTVKRKGANATVTSLTVKQGSNSVYSGTVNPGSQKVSVNTKGSTKYDLSATADGMTVTGSAVVNMVLPIYFGFAEATSASVLNITSLGKQAIKTSPGGTYTLTNGTEGHYMWLCVPDTMTISRVTLNGFDVPMEAAQSASTSLGGYKCYRSSNALVAQSYTIVIS